MPNAGSRSTRPSSTSSSASQNARNDRRHQSLRLPSPVPTSPVKRAQRSARLPEIPCDPGMVSKGRAAALPLVVGGVWGRNRNARGAPSRRPQAAESPSPPSPPPQRRAKRRERHTEKAGASPPGAPGAGAPAALSGPGGSRARSGAAAERRPGPPPPQGATDGAETAPPHGTRGAGPQPPGRASSNRRARPPQGPDDCDEEPGADAHGCEHSFCAPEAKRSGATGLGSGGSPGARGPGHAGDGGGTAPRAGTAIPAFARGGAHGGPTNRACSSRQGFQRYPSSA